MDSETIYALVGFTAFAFIAYFTLRSDSSSEAQSKDEKRFAILREYRNELRAALAPLVDDKEKKLAKKSELLKKFSDELSQNIFFDSIEIREIILDLAEEY